MQVMSQRFTKSVGISSHGNQDEEPSGVRGTEMATGTITVLSKYVTTGVCHNTIHIQTVLKSHVHLWTFDLL